MPNIHKNKALKKGGEKGTRWVDPSPSKKNENHQPGWITRGTRSNQVLNPPQTQGAYEISRERRNHLKEHLT